MSTNMEVDKTGGEDESNSVAVHPVSLEKDQQQAGSS